ncbi:MAG: hypothetical protein WBG50_01090 [Desulfomonilaceae bacterium]
MNDRKVTGEDAWRPDRPPETGTHGLSTRSPVFLSFFEFRTVRHADAAEQ